MPFRKALTRGGIKPAAGATVDWGDPIARGLVARYLFNDTNYPGIRDCVRNFHLRNYSGATSAPGALGGMCAKFDGVSGKARVEDYGSATGKRPVISAPPFTLCGWAKLVSASTLYIVALADEATIDNDYAIDVRTASFNVNAKDASNGTILATSSFAPALGRWYFVCGVFASATDRRLYVDGRLAATSTTSVSPIGLDNTTMGALIRSDASYGNGCIDNVSIYNRALAPGEIARLFSEPFAGIVAPRRRIISSIPSSGAASRFFLAMT